MDELAALFPDAATYLGIAGHDHRWPDFSPAGYAHISASLTALIGRIEALPPANSMWERLAVAVNSSLLAEELGFIEQSDHLRNLDSIASPVQDWRQVFDHMGKKMAEEWRNVAARMEALPRALEQHRASLDDGRAQGMAVSRRQVLAVAKQCRAFASDDSPFAALPAELSDAALAEHAQVAALVTSAIGTARAGYEAMAVYLEDVYLPDAAEHEAVGEDRYLRAAYRHLGTRIEPLDTYQWGWDEVARLRSRMEEVADQIAQGEGIAAALDVLKTDPDRLAPDHESFVEFLQQRVDEALEELAGTHFDVPDQIRTCVVNVAPPGGPLGAYYVGPSEDFTRPGTVWWSLSPDDPISLYDEVSTAYHEGFPGHHLQVGIQISLADRLSRLHRMFAWKAGIGEGWALYAELLMDELGYLDKPDYVFGFLSGQMLRACRVVIDIGSHLGYPIPDDQPFHPGEAWTFDNAVEMLMEYATLEKDYAESEVTRYLGWPGQAIAYKVGERMILDARSELEKRLGSEFDLRAFHARLLEIGPVSIDLMREFLLEDG